MTSPIGTGPPRSSPLPVPATMSWVTSFAAELTFSAMLRSGMYSANGTGCRLTYIAPGPVVGDQRIPALRR